METTRWVSNGAMAPEIGCSTNAPRSRSAPDRIRTTRARFRGRANPVMSSVSAAATGLSSTSGSGGTGQRHSTRTTHLELSFARCCRCPLAERHSPRTRTATFRVAARYLWNALTRAATCAFASSTVPVSPRRSARPMERVFAPTPGSSVASQRAPSHPPRSAACRPGGEPAPRA